MKKYYPSNLNKKIKISNHRVDIKHRVKLLNNIELIKFRNYKNKLIKRTRKLSN
jgi:hypothetical protein